MKIDLYILAMMSIIISDGKEHAENTGKKPDLVGLSENPPPKTQKKHFLQNSQRDMSNIKDMHYTICLNVISSSGRFALPPLFGELEQRGVM